MQKTKVITGIDTRLSYFHGWEPTSVNGGPARYSTAILIPKSDTQTVQAIIGAINAALEQGIAKFGGKMPNRATLKLPLRDGDVESEDEAYKGHYFLNAHSKSAPQIVDQNIKKITDRSEVYSGCYARVSLNFFAYNVDGNRGVAVGLGNIQKIRDGESFEKRSSAEEDFGTKEETSSFDDFGTNVEYEEATDFLD